MALTSCVEEGLDKASYFTIVVVSVAHLASDTFRNKKKHSQATLYGALITDRDFKDAGA